MTEPENTPFLRQRRNLIIISVVLLLLDFSSVDFRNAKVFDIEMTFRHPEVIPGGLWIAGFYWFLRYYQYFRKSEYPNLRSRWRIELYELLKEAAQPRALKNYEPPRDIRNGTTTLTPTTFEVNHHLLREVSLRIGFQVATASPDGNAASATSMAGTNFDFSYRELLIPRIRAAWRLFLHTPEVTQYVLPPLLFSSACGIKVWQLIGPISK
jgi:hypothetical protein